MPFIPKKDRWQYDESLEPLITTLALRGWQMGHVTYAVYTIIVHWFYEKTKFQTIGEIRGMLTSVLSEFDRRHASGYEDDKIKENSDIHVWDIEVPHDDS